ncbi:MAG TPA: sulfur transferase domain-containing protein [Candidatus Acidoferrales bacterium]|nr:sulfur transferase domain-containing protein [Candidatus Acidoferrales bacterium]
MNNEGRVGAFTIGGQPSEADLRRLQSSGHQTVINVRMPEEPGQLDAAAIEGLGLEYVSIPYTGATLNADHVRLVREAVDAAGGSVLIH